MGLMLPSSNAVLELEIAAAGTQFQADEATRKAYETFIGGSKWMIFVNTATNVLHWDFVSCLAIHKDVS